MQPSYEQPNDALWAAMHWIPSSKQLEQFLTLQKLLNHFDKQINLTRLLQGEDYWIGQVFDSLWPFQRELNDSSKSLNCIDVGTGCGFPGLAVAIALPKIKLTLVDATSKKTMALSKITTELDLDSRVKILTERIEVTGQNRQYRGTFDLAMARAVAEAPVAAEYLMPLIKPNGEALLYIGKWSQFDNKVLTKALKPLKGKIKTIQTLELPGHRGTRHLIHLEAISTCPDNYPRPIGLPKKRPLGV